MYQRNINCTVDECPDIELFLCPGETCPGHKGNNMLNPECDYVPLSYYRKKEPENQPKKKREKNIWTNEQEQYIIINYGVMSIQEISEKLGHTYRAVENRAGVLRKRGFKVRYYADQNK